MSTLPLTIGIAQLDVVPQLSRDFGAQVTRQVSAPIETSAQQAGRRFGAGIGRTAVAAVTGLGIGAAIGKALQTGFGEVKDYQAGLAQLTAGLKSSGNVAGLTAGQMEDLASNIQDYSGQTDDSIVATESLLLTFTNIRDQAGQNNDIFTQTTKIAADMAARLGGDASSAAIQLGKALNDPVQGITALTRVGVSFTDGQKKQIKALQDSGDTMGAQKIILAELNKEFGGSAKAFGETLPGQIEKSRRKFEDITQSLVTSLTPAINTLLSGLQGLIGFVSANAGWLLPLVGGIAAFATAVWAVNAATRAWTAVQTAAKAAAVVWTGVQWALNAALDANPIGLVVLAVAGLVAGLIFAWKNSETFRDIVTGVFHAVSDVVGSVVGFVKQHLIDFSLALLGPIGWIGVLWRNSETFRDIVTGAFRVVGDVIGAVVGFVQQHMIDFGLALLGPIGWLAVLWRNSQTMRDIVSGVFRDVGNVISGIAGTARQMLSDISGVFTDLGNTISGWASGAIHWLYQAGRDVLTGFWDGLKSVWKDLTGWFSGIAGWIKDHKGPLSLDAQLLVPHGKAIMGGFQQGLESGFASVGSFVGGVAGNIAGLLRPGGGFRGDFPMIINALRSTGVPFTVTSTTGGGHAAGSYHYQGRAVDFAGPNLMAIARALLQITRGWSELFYTPLGFSIKNGAVTAPIAAAEHYNHVHAAYRFGTPYVPETGPYLLHRSEMVLSPEDAAVARSGGGAMGPAVVVENYHPTVAADVELLAARVDYLRRRGRPFG